MLVQMLVLNTTAQVPVREILRSKESKKLSQVPAEDEPRKNSLDGLGEENLVGKPKDALWNPET